MGDLKLTSTAFSNMQKIPSAYGCGASKRPPLSIDGIPNKTISLAIIVDDPDAPGGTWVHWAIWNIEPTNKIAETGIPKGGIEGMTDYGALGYGAPCPPPGKPHRYFYKLYALDAKLSLAQGSTKEELEAAMTGHILAQTQLIGTFQR